MRRQLFISYSHEDQAFLEAFQQHLKPFVVTGSLDIWTDRDIEPGQKWHDDIQRALRRTAAAVLLVSPAFLASDYIRQNELPALLRDSEAERISLLCLYVRPSVADAYEIPITLDTGRVSTVRLTDYQGLNSPPEEVIASRPDHEHDDLYAQAAKTLERLMAGISAIPVQPASDDRFDLTIQLTLQDEHLTRVYWSRDKRLQEADPDPWQGVESDDSGPALFQTLFPTEAICDEIFTDLFRVDPAAPTRFPVRLRLWTNAPAIANLPWSDTTWQGTRLHDLGWTFECIGGEALQAAPQYPDVTLHAPCSVLMIASSQTPEAEGHHRALEERLHHAWPQFHDKPLWAKTWAEVEAAWQQRAPRIVYYYGPADSDGQTLSLHLDDPAPCSVSSLVSLWGAKPPEIFFCNLVASPPAPGIAMSYVSAPLIITQHSPDAAAARRTALAWLHELLVRGENTDPVWTLHEHGHDTAVAWGAYHQWRTRTAPEPNKDHLVKLLLDRRMQRSLASTAINDLLRDRRQRLYCVLAYGQAGNLADRFADQLYEHLRRNFRELAQVHRLPMRLPRADTFDLDKLHL